MFWLRDLRYQLRAAAFLSPLEQNAFQRGWNEIPRWRETKPLTVEVLGTVGGCGFGIAVGGSWPVRGILGATCAVAGLLLAWFFVWMFFSARGFYRQRKEARERVAEWEDFFSRDEAWSARSRLAYEVNTNIALQSRWLEGQVDYKLKDALEDWRHRAEGWFRGLEELGDEPTANRLRQRLEELATAPDLASADAVMARLGTDLLNAAACGRLPSPQIARRGTTL